MNDALIMSVGYGVILLGAACLLLVAIYGVAVLCETIERRTGSIALALIPVVILVLLWCVVLGYGIYAG